MSQVLQKVIYGKSQHPICSVVSTIERIQRPRNQEMEVGVVSLAINPGISLVFFFPSCFQDSVICLSRDLNSKVRNISTRRHNNSTELEVKIAISHIGTLFFWISGQGMELLCWLGCLILTAKGNLHRLLHNRGKEEYVLNTGDHLRHLFVFPCPVKKTNETPQ